MLIIEFDLLGGLLRTVVIEFLLDGSRIEELFRLMPAMSVAIIGEPSKTPVLGLSILAKGLSWNLDY